MSLLMVLEMLGGLGLFILGMKTLAEGLQRLAAGGFRRFIEKMAGNRLSAALAGSFLTSLLQSSGAASILIISFVNAGLLSLYQALGMLIGTGLGTLLAVQLIAFKITFLSLPAIFVGVVFRFFSKSRRLVFLGEILMGFGLLFFGLEVMEARLTPLGENSVVGWYRSLPFDWRIASVLTGAFLTLLTQSGSAAIGIIIAMTGSGVLGVEQAAAMIPGEVLGVAALAGISTIGGTPAARRTVFFYTIISICSIAVVLTFFPYFLKLVSWLTPGSRKILESGIANPDSRAVIARTIANSYTVFSVLLILVFLPSIGFIARTERRIIPGRNKTPDLDAHSRYLDFRVVNTPSLALLQAGNELKRMSQTAQSMVSETVAQFFEFNSKRSSQIKQMENLLDVLQKELSGFLVTLARQPLTVEISADIPIFLSVINDLEEIGDNCETILECLLRKKDGNVYFSETAMRDIKSLAGKTSDMVNLAVDSLESLAFPETELIRTLKEDLLRTADELKQNHLIRLSTGSCSVIAGLLFVEIISAFARIGEFSSSIIETGRGIR